MRKTYHYLLLGAGLSAAGVFAEGKLDELDTASRKVGYDVASSLSLGVYSGTDPNTGELCTVVVRDEGKYYFAKDRVKMLEISVIAATKTDPYAGLKTGNVTQMSLGQPPEISSGTDSIPVDPPAAILRQFAGIDRDTGEHNRHSRTLPNPVARYRKADNQIMLETRSLSYRYREEEDGKPVTRSRDQKGNIVRQTGTGTALGLMEREQKASIDLKEDGVLNRITIETRKGTSKLADGETTVLDNETIKPEKQKVQLSTMSNKAFQAWKKDWNRPTEAKGDVKNCGDLVRIEQFPRTWTELEPKAPTVTPPPAAEAKPAPKPAPAASAQQAKPAAAPVAAPKANLAEGPTVSPALLAFKVPHAARALSALTPPVVKNSAPKADADKEEKEKEPVTAESAPIPAGPHTEAAAPLDSGT